MRTLALKGRRFAREDAMESESEVEERERLFWEDIEDDFISRHARGKQRSPFHTRTTSMSVTHRNNIAGLDGRYCASLSTYTITLEVRLVE